MDTETLFNGLEVTPEMVSIQALNPFMDTNSSPRSVMFGNHLGQYLVLNHGEEKLIQTGLESKVLGDYVHDIRFPKDCTVLKVIPRYRKGLELEHIPANPETIVIYEEIDTGDVGYISIPEFGSFHSYFGFKYKLTEEAERIRPGESFDAETVIVEPVSKKPNNGYSYGVNLNIAYVSIPHVAEDGFVVSESALKKLQFSIFEKRTVNIGETHFPLNLYGDESNYKPFPDIGEYIHESGVITALRKFDKDYIPALMSKTDVLKYNPMFDTPVYARGAKGKVIDIKVHYNEQKRFKLFKEMRPFIEKYAKGLNRFYDEVLEFKYKHANTQERKFNKSDVNFTPDMHRLLVEAYSAVGKKYFKNIGRVNKTFKGDTLDEFKITFVIEYVMPVGIGNKLTDTSGGKGVICKIVPDNEMPIDLDGNRAELLIDPSSTISRMNLGRLYEQYISSTIVKVNKVVRNALKDSGLDVDNERINELFTYVLNYLQIISPEQYGIYSDVDSIEDRRQILAGIVDDTLRVYYPVNGKRSHMDIVGKLENSIYKPMYGPISYITNGKKHTTKDNVRIGPQYIMLLEKIADQWMAASTTSINHFHIPATVNKENSSKLPWRSSAVRIAGETEIRIFSSYCDKFVTAEILDRNANVSTHMHIYNNILAAKTPTNIDLVVNRVNVPYGETNPLKLVKHVAQCRGFKFTYEPEVL